MTHDHFPFSVDGVRRPVRRDDLELVDLGCTVFALHLDEDTDADAVRVRGGQVLYIGTHQDHETGELERLFMTARVDGRRVRFDSIRASEVRQITAPNPAVLKSLLQAMGRVVADTRMSTDVQKCADGIGQITQILNGAAA